MSTTATKPNILWICTDQQRWDSLGCYGNRFVRTPNLDRLAAGGVRFDNAFSQSPVCTPSRASFLTGRYPRTCRTRQNGADIPADEVLVTKMLCDAGYVCGLSGKLHLSACNPVACPVTERRIDDGYDQFHWSHDTADIWPTNEYYQSLRDKGVQPPAQPSPHSDFLRSGYPEEHHQTTWCTDRAISFIRSASAKRMPWLFSLNIFDPHHSFDPPEEYLRPYLDRLDEIPLPNYTEGELDTKTAWQRFDHDGAYGHGAGFAWEKMSDRDHRLVRAAYWAMCDLIDVQVGRLIAFLEEVGELQNTIVIFMSDHGEMLGDHGIYLKGPYFYEPAVHVPLIVSMPGTIPAGTTSPALVELVDLPQTLLDAVGIEHHPGMQGRSLWPMLTGVAGSAHHRDDIYCEYYNAMPWHRGPTAQATMVRTPLHKLTVDHTRSEGELYDLASDPDETTNLWDNPEAAPLRSDMLLRLANRMAFTVDPLPPRRGPW